MIKGDGAGDNDGMLIFPKDEMFLEITGVAKGLGVVLKDVPDKGFKSLPLGKVDLVFEAKGINSDIVRFI